MLRPLRTIRRLISAVLILIVLVIVGVIALFVHMDNVAQYIVERGTTDALGVESRTDRVHISLLRRTVTAEQLIAANPEGYQGPRLMEATSVRAHVVPQTLFSPVVEVPRVEIDELTLHIEQHNRRTNFNAVLDHLQQGRTEEPRRRFQVDRVIIRNIVAHVQVVEQLGELGRVTVTIPELVLDDVANEDARGVAIAEITRRLLPAVVAAVLEQGDQLPDQLATTLRGGVRDLIRSAGGELENILDRALEGALEDLGGQIDQLFRRNSN